MKFSKVLLILFHSTSPNFIKDKEKPLFLYLLKIIKLLKQILLEVNYQQTDIYNNINQNSYIFIIFSFLKFLNFNY